MNDHMNRKEIQERFADSAVAMFMEQYMTEIAEVADENAEDDSIEISEEFDRRGRKLIKKGLAKKQRQHAAKKLLRIAKVAVITFFIFLGTFAILFTTVEAIRVPIINFFLEQKEEYLEITGRDDNTVINGNPLEGLLPAEYELELCDIASPENSLVVYSNQQGNYIRFFSGPSTGTLHADNEDAATERVFISDREAILISKNGYRLIWSNSDGSQLYQLETDALTREEIIAIAEKVKNN